MRGAGRADRFTIPHERLGRNANPGAIERRGFYRLPWAHFSAQVFSIIKTIANTAARAVGSDVGADVYQSDKYAQAAPLHTAVQSIFQRILTPSSASYTVPASKLPTPARCRGRSIMPELFQSSPCQSLDDTSESHCLNIAATRHPSPRGRNQRLLRSFLLLLSAASEYDS